MEFPIDRVPCGEYNSHFRERVSVSFMRFVHQRSYHGYVNYRYDKTHTVYGYINTKEA